MLANKTNVIELCQEKEHLKNLERIKQDLVALNSLDSDDIGSQELQQIKVYEKYFELANLGLNIAVFKKGIEAISYKKELITGRPCFRDIQITNLSELHTLIGNEKQKANGGLAKLKNLQCVLPDMTIGESIHGELQEALDSLDDIIKRRSDLVMYKECYSILANLVGLPDIPTNKNIQAIMETFKPEEVEKIIKSRKGKKDSFPVIMRGIHGLWKEGICIMFIECQRIDMNKISSFQLILEFLSVVFPDIWGYSEETKPKLIKLIEGQSTR